MQTTRLAVDRSADALARLRDRQVGLGRRLLAVVAKVEGVLARGKLESEVERSLREHLAGLRAALTAHDAVAARLDALLRAQRAREEREAAAAAAHHRHGGGHLAPGDVEALQRQLEAQRGGIEQLMAVVAKDKRDLQIVRTALDQEAARARQVDGRQAVLGFGPPAAY